MEERPHGRIDLDIESLRLTALSCRSHLFGQNPANDAVITERTDHMHDGNVVGVVRKKVQLRLPAVS